MRTTQSFGVERIARALGEATENQIRLLRQVRSGYDRANGGEMIDLGPPEREYVKTIELVMNSIEPENHDLSPPPASFLSWPAIFVVGWIIYEVTQNPGMAAMAMCLKFGWEDFRTARWLNRRDPDQDRGRACSWLYVASGLWQVAVIGVAMVTLTIVLCSVIDFNVQGVKPAADLFHLLVGALITVLFGFVFSSVATYIALLSARRLGVRPWLNGGVHIARRNQCWPPLYGQNNRVMILVVSTLVVTFVILVPAGLIIGRIVLKPLLPWPLLAGLGLIVPIFCYIVLLPASTAFVIQLSRQRFFAEHPADCWGDVPLPKATTRMEDRETV